MGRIYQRREGGTYWGYWTDVKGRARRQTLRTRDQVTARARLRQLELVSTEPAAHAHHTLRAAIGDLLNVVETENAGATWGAYRQKGEQLVDHLGDVELAGITRDALLQYIRRRKLAGKSDSTIHKEFVVLRRALVEARNRSLWVGDVATLVPTIRVRYEPRERWLTAAQATAMLAELARDRRLWAALAAWGGMCLSEIERLRWEHVDLRRARIRVPGRKRPSRWRVIPIAPALAPMLKRAATGSQSHECVVRRWPNVRRDLAAAVTRANRRATDRAATRKRKAPAPMPVVSPNDLRRTFASWLKQRGIDSHTVAKLLGHNSSRMVELVYGQLSNDSYERAIAALPRAAA